jgi:2-iminobutanoate/2-iminopropanoate deaminase
MKKYLQLFTVLSLVWCSSVSCQEKPGITFHESHEEKKRSAPYSDAVEAGNLFFLAGQIGMDHTTRTMVTPGIESETEQAIKNIRAVLEYHGLTLDNVVKCTVILSTMDDFSAFNEVYSKYFTKKPARTTFAASGLARNAKIEIDVIAVRN